MCKMDVWGPTGDFLPELFLQLNLRMEFHINVVSKENNQLVIAVSTTWNAPTDHRGDKETFTISIEGLELGVLYKKVNHLHMEVACTALEQSQSIATLTKPKSIYYMPLNLSS